jgi:hypothetical protein
MMLHLFLEKGAWFRAKRYGYGAGLPFRWQGWVVLIAHVALLVGLGFALSHKPVALMIALTLVTIAPMPIYAARTEGGWHWRTGQPREKEDQKRR